MEHSKDLQLFTSRFLNHRMISLEMEAFRTVDVIHVDPHHFRWKRPLESPSAPPLLDDYKVSRCNDKKKGST